MTAAIAAFLIGLHLVTADAQGELSGLGPPTTPAGVAISPVENASETGASTVRTFASTAAVSSEAASVSSNAEDISSGSAALEPETTPVAAVDARCEPSGAAGPYCIYEVQPDDTLAGIARELGLEGSGRFDAAALIAMSNGLVPSDSGLIHPGQELRVPSREGVIHTVQASQSLSILAEQYGVSSSDIAAANAIADADQVTVGRVLLIPSPTHRPSSSSNTAEETARAASEAEGSPLDQPEGEAGGSQESQDVPEQGQETATNANGNQAEPAGSNQDVSAAVNEDAASEADQDDDSADSTVSSAEAETGDDGSNEGEADDRSEPDDESDAGASAANLSEQAIREQFASGYRAAGGPERFLDILLDVTIPCESSYNLTAYNPAGPFFGLLQFLAGTWNRSGGGDWKDPWQQGANAGRLLRSSSPTTQWPYCWPA